MDSNVGTLLSALIAFISAIATALISNGTGVMNKRLLEMYQSTSGREDRLTSIITEEIERKINVERWKVKHPGWFAFFTILAIAGSYLATFCTFVFIGVVVGIMRHDEELLAAFGTRDTIQFVQALYPFLIVAGVSIVVICVREPESLSYSEQLNKGNKDDRKQQPKHRGRVK